MALVYNLEGTSFVFFFYDSIGFEGPGVANIGFQPSLFTSGQAFQIPGVLFGGGLSTISSGSNIGVPGVYGYRVDQLNILQPRG